VTGGHPRSLRQSTRQHRPCSIQTSGRLLQVDGGGERQVQLRVAGQALPAGRGGGP
jgi:hypothetical protein